MRVELFISGINPVPWTASEASIGRKGKQVYVQFHKSAALTAYQEAIRENFKEAYPAFEMFPKGADLWLDMYFWRQLDSGTTGEGRRHRAHSADRTNIQKSTEDALQKLIFPNDVRVITGLTAVVEQGPDVQPFIQIMIMDWEKNAARIEQPINIMREAPSPPGNVYMKVYEEG